jgi:hypothetical protein
MQLTLIPLLLMLILPILVVTKMFIDRVIEMKGKKIHPQSIATRLQSQEKLTNSKASDNFKNLFEAPVLFYVIALTSIVLNYSHSLFVGLCWTYVFTRYIHSFIHCTYNKVMHRFYAFTASMIVLFLLLMQLGFHILTIH